MPSKKMVTLVQPYFHTEENLDRARELQKCRQVNMNLPQVDIYLPSLGSKARMKFSHVFDPKNQFPEGIVILANSDIFFDETLKNIHEIKEDEFYCLSRIDIVEGERIPFHVSHSQDVWVFRWPMKFEIKDTEFHLGVLGCDNVLALKAEQAGYTVKNPCSKINCFHLHESGYRTYKKEDRLPKPYKFVDPE